MTPDRMHARMPSLAVGDPDLVIRTGGERRISNFLLFGLAYAELYFDDALWPDFGPASSTAPIASYQARERRFGLVGAAAATTLRSPRPSSPRRSPCSPATRAASPSSDS